MKHIPFLSLIILYFTACTSHSPIQTFDENGLLFEEYSVNNDSLKHGEYIRYRPDGTIVEKSNYTQGKLDGERLLYFTNGNIEIKEHYNNDILNGFVETYYPSGKLELELPYKNGVLSGTSKKYFEHGAIKEEVIFEQNNENGPFREFHFNGNIKWEGNYIDGVEFGELLNFNEEGVMIKKMKCDTFLENCRTIWTLEKGDIELEEIFDKS